LEIADDLADSVSPALYIVSMSTSNGLWRLQTTWPTVCLLLFILCTSLAAANEHGQGAVNDLEGAESAHDNDLEGAESAHESGELHAHKGGHGEDVEIKGEATLAVSTMLLGTITFIMSIFYLVNHHDEDIRLNTWKVLSSTIALFVAVLLYRGISSLFSALMTVTVKRRFEEHTAQGIIIILKFILLLAWFLAMHITIRRLCKQRAAVNEETMDTRRRRDSEQKVHCWANLFSHMTGFAAIGLGVELQHFGSFTLNPWMTLVPVLLLAIFLFCLFRMSDYYRSLVQANDVSEAVQFWCEHGEETENEIGGLSLSFMLVQSLVFWSIGTLPPVHEEHHGGGEGHHPSSHGPKHHAEHGLEEHHHLTPWTSSIGVMVVGLICACITMVMVYWQHHLPNVNNSNTRRSAYVSAHVGLDRFEVYLTRWYFIIQLIFVMCTSWCFLFLSEWEVNRFLHWCAPSSGDILDPHMTMQRVLMALVVSFASFILIFGLDTLHDMDLTDRVAEAAIRKVIKAIGILIGFSWEESFHASVAAFAELSDGLLKRTMVEFLLGLALAIIIVPAWRLYILQNVLRLTEGEECVEVEDRDYTGELPSRTDTRDTQYSLQEIKALVK